MMRPLPLLLLTLLLTAAALAGDLPRPDYADPGNWISRPGRPDKSFDVFYMHPTTYAGTADGMNAKLTDVALNAHTDVLVRHQASVFTATCNLFAPRYRQASIEVLSMGADERQRYLSVGLEDMRAAFEYYLKHHNGGRPYLLAGHSQGSNDTLEFLRKYPHLVDRRQFVAAYVIGWTVTDDDLKQIGMPLATWPGQTGAIITWNTIGQGGNSPVLLPGALCVNPLNWGTSHVEQPKTLNSYASIHSKDFSSATKVPHFTEATIDERGGLVIPTPADVDQLTLGMGPEVYHSYDYDFFYGNLVENVAERCRTWRQQHP